MRRTLTNLPAGNYSVEVVIIDQNNNTSCTTTVAANVPGTYEAPSPLNATAHTIYCPNGLGRIVVNPFTGGRSPWNYAIINGPLVRPAQSSPEFNNLPAGSYELQATDACGVIRTSTYTVAYDTAQLTFGAGIIYTKIGCNNLGVGLNQMGWENTSVLNRPVRVSWVNPNGDSLVLNTGFETTPVVMDTILGAQNTGGVYKAYVEDTCGRIYSTSSTFDPSYYLYGMGINEHCDSFMPFWNIGNHLDIDITWNIRKVSDNSVFTSVNDTRNFIYTSPEFPKRLAYGTDYYLEMVKHCPNGDVVLTGPNFNRAFQPLETAIRTGPGCMVPGTGSIVFGAPSSNKYPVTHKIIAGPERVGDSVTHTGPGGLKDIRNLALGTYVILTKDSCNATKLDPITVNIELVLQKNFTVIPRCDDNFDVNLDVRSNYFRPFSNGPLTRVATTNPSYTIHNISQTYHASESNPMAMNIWTGELINISPSSNRLILQIVSNNDGGPCIDYDTINLIPYALPEILSAEGYVCATGDALINLDIINGKAPYSYRIKPSSSQTWSTTQSTLDFGYLAPGAYDVEAFDACINSDIYGFEILPFEPVRLVGPRCGTVDEEVTLRPIFAIEGVTYEWKKGTQTLGTDNVFTIPNYTRADSGTYTLTQTLPGSCALISNYILLDCQTLTLTMTQFYGTTKGCQLEKNWITVKEEQLDFYTVEGSNDGLHFETIVTLPAANKPNHYQVTLSETANKFHLFRIKTNELDGSVAYSKVISLEQPCDAVNTATYPSPTTNDLFLKSTQLQKVKVVNSLGKIVNEIEMRQHTEHIDVSHLPKGVYIFQFELAPNAPIKIVIE